MKRPISPSRAVTAKRNVPKSMLHVQSIFFFVIKPVAFLTFSLPSPSSLLKLPDLNWTTTAKNAVRRHNEYNNESAEIPTPQQ